MRGRFPAQPLGRVALWAALMLFAPLVACDPSFSLPPPTEPGAACDVDEDCVPNACCGRGTGVVHVSQAPNCRSATCDGTCSPATVQCGCGIPVCRDRRCGVAVTIGPGC